MAQLAFDQLELSQRDRRFRAARCPLALLQANLPERERHSRWEMISLPKPELGRPNFATLPQQPY